MSNTDNLLATEEALKTLLEEMMQLKSATELVKQAGASTQQVVLAAEQVTKTAVNVYEQSGQLLSVLDKAHIDEKLIKLESEIERFEHSLLKIKAEIEAQRDELLGRHLENSKKFGEIVAAQEHSFSDLQEKSAGIQEHLEAFKKEMDASRVFILEKLGSIMAAQDVHFETFGRIIEKIDSISIAQNTHFESVFVNIKELGEQFPLVMDQFEDVKQKNQLLLESLLASAEQAENRDRALDNAVTALQKYSKVNRILISCGIGMSAVILGIVIYLLILKL